MRFKLTIASLIVMIPAAGFAGTDIIFRFGDTTAHYDSVGRKILTEVPGSGLVNGAAQAPNGDIYVCAGSNLIRVDPSTGAGVIIGNSGIDLRALTFVGNTLYGISAMHPPSTGSIR